MGELQLCSCERRPWKKLVLKLQLKTKNPLLNPQSNVIQQFSSGCEEDTVYVRVCVGSQDVSSSEDEDQSGMSVELWPLTLIGWQVLSSSVQQQIELLRL